jgi:hypothetical protein
MNVAEFTEWITCKVIRKCKKYTRHANYVTAVPPYDSTFTLTTGLRLHIFLYELPPKSMPEIL